MYQNKQKAGGWITAFIFGYMTSSTAGKFITENIVQKITYVIFTDSEMNLGNLVKKVLKLLNCDNEDAQMETICILLSILVFVAICMLRFPAFSLAVKIKSLL
ncbi:hypothetical protein [Aminipila sp.]|uniref:hypothetical protein n=1 Tax=Aminipila sp. TaxID=2060095 RepID=UPI002897AA70|nr:hypothetical protein [Aminipila sp.]